MPKTFILAKFFRQVNRHSLPLTSDKIAKLKMWMHSINVPLELPAGEKLVKIHGHEEFRICLNFTQPAFKQFYAFHRIHVAQNPTQAIDQFQFFGIH